MHYPYTLEMLVELKSQIVTLGQTFGFSQVGFSDLDLTNHQTALLKWLENKYHGEMKWMENHIDFRLSPNKLVEETLSAIVVRLDYLPPNAKFAKVLGNSQLGYISRYALGRDYHKVLRKKLSQFADQVKALTETFLNQQHIVYRAFVDSAPILERPLAARAGLGFIGKHSLLINPKVGSWFFIGELLINLPLHLTSSPIKSLEFDSSCGQCKACRTICPTGAIIDDFVVDARKCISYLTIEHKSAIPIELRPLIGNRIYGCDDCQLICPFNKIAPITETADFIPNQKLEAPLLISLFSWNETQFLNEMKGSPIRRIGYQAWLRNIAVAIGNCQVDSEQKSHLITHLKGKLGVSELVDEHIYWAIERHTHADILPTQQQNRLVRSIQKGLPRDA